MRDFQYIISYYNLDIGLSAIYYGNCYLLSEYHLNSSLHVRGNETVHMSLLVNTLYRVLVRYDY